jgi:enoyl-CoA hydratase
LDALWAGIGQGEWPGAEAVKQACVAAGGNADAAPGWPDAGVDRVFALPDVPAIMRALSSAALGDTWAAGAAAALARRSPLMLHVTLEQLRRARGMDLASELRMERDLVRRCFHPAHLARSGAAVEVVEGIRALAVDKDHQPRWNPLHVAAVRPDIVAPFFDSPWPAHAHPLRDLG